MAPGRGGAASGRTSQAAQPPRAAQQRVVQQRVQQVRRAIAEQQRRTGRQPRTDPQRGGQQRRIVQQRRSGQQRVQPSGVDLQRQLEQLRQQQQRLRVWQRTAGKRAARQVETEQAIMQREERLRAYERARTADDALPARVGPAEHSGEPETYESYVRRRHGEAMAATAAAARRSTALDSLLPTVLASPVEVGLAGMRRRVTRQPFDAGGLDHPLVAPRPEQFEPTAQHLPSWLPGQRGARERARGDAVDAYRRAVAAYEAAEFDRVRRLSAARLDHQQREAAAADEVRLHNAAVDAFEAALRAGDPAAVERYSQLVLSGRRWPQGVVVAWRLRYEPDLRQLDAECLLPGPEVVPRVRRYRYVPAVDAERRQFVPAAEVHHRYADFVAQAALAALFDLFRALDPAVVEVVQLNARVSGFAADTGEPVRPYVVSIAASHAEWAELPLDAAPEELLRRLDARVSPDPAAGVGVRPWAELDPT